MIAFLLILNVELTLDKDALYNNKQSASYNIHWDNHNSNKMKTTKEMIEIMTAFDNGAEIEVTNKFANDKLYWVLTYPSWNWNDYDYRIKELFQGKTEAERKTIEDAWNGKKSIECNIQYKYNGDTIWENYTHHGYPDWIWNNIDYRIKPKDTYISYTTETWKQDIERFKYMFIVNKYDGKYIRIIDISPEDEKPIGVSFTNISFADLLNCFNWEDGTPCGTKSC